MARESSFVSSLVASGAKGYASAAAHRLLEEHPETGKHFARGAFNAWSRHLAQRSRELAAALQVEEPALFASEAAWSAASFDAAEIPIEDLRASLECLRQTLEEDLPEHVREIPRPFFEEALARLAQPSAVAPTLATDSEHSKLTLAYLDAALNGDRRRAIELLLSAVEDGLDVGDAYTKVLQEAQMQVGDLWHARQLAIAHEHAVSATTNIAMELLAHRTGGEREANGKTVVVAVVQGNAHEFGARVVSHFFEMEGWKAIHLGSELPPKEIATGVAVFEADLLALSITLSTQIRAAVDTIEAARAARPGLKVLVGGRAIAPAPNLWQKLGADGSANSPAEALEVAARLTS